ncbi:MAG: hypothetical protein K6T90_13150 [Leptolyngbyaceae cyanobacterium HOT.MB2.61]|jgi:hypothetical protein|nr:hypothetical protein [Leptolyngbyaceae cyanobacterium HOT.MB2.61]
MQLVEIVQRVLETGELPMNLERQMQKLLQQQEFSEEEMAAIDQLIEAINCGSIRSVPDKKLRQSQKLSSLLSPYPLPSPTSHSD